MQDPTKNRLAFLLLLVGMAGCGGRTTEAPSGANTGGGGGGGGHGGTDPYASADRDYDCEVMGPVDPRDVQEYRKVVIVGTRYVDGYERLDAESVTIRYGTGPDHLLDWPDGYQVIVEADDGAVVDSFSHLHPAVAWPEGSGCVWIPPQDAAPTEIFDFIQPRARALRLLDVNDEIVCENGTYVGTAEQLLLLDLRPCLDAFCNGLSAPGDPVCP